MPTRQGTIDARHHIVMPQVHPPDGPKTFASKHVRGRMRSSFPSPGCILRGPSHDGKAMQLDRPVGSGRFGKLRLPRGQTLRSDTFTFHDVEQHAQAEAERCASWMNQWRIPVFADGHHGSVAMPRCRWLRLSRPSLPSPAEAVVEQDGIEPTTSCLQSTRSTD